MKKQSIAGKKQTACCPSPKGATEKRGPFLKSKPVKETKPTIERYQKQIERNGPGFVIRGDFALGSPDSALSDLPTESLADNLHAGLVELLKRARTDKAGTALMAYYRLIHTFVGELQDALLVDVERGKSVASKYDVLPVFASGSNYKEILTTLRVGENFHFNTFGLRNIQWNNLWTVYAHSVLGAIYNNARWMFEIGILKGSTLNDTKVVDSFDKQQHKLFTVQNHNRCFNLFEWQLECGRVALPFTACTEEIAKIKNIAKECVLLYWKNNSARYSEALGFATKNRMSLGIESEARQRNYCIQQIRKALDTLIRVRKNAIPQQ